MRRRKYPWKQADILIYRYCRRLTTGQRLAVIAVAFALFMAGCLYMILSSLLGFGEPGGGLWIDSHPFSFRNAWGVSLFRRS